MNLTSGVQILDEGLLHHMKHRLVQFILVIIILLGLVETDMLHTKLQQYLVT